MAAEDNPAVIDTLVPLTLTLNVPQLCTFELVAGQLQRVYPGIIAVEDGVYLHLFATPDKIPKGLVPEDAAEGRYCFRDAETRSLFTFFTEEAAHAIDPALYPKAVVEPVELPPVPDGEPEVEQAPLEPPVDTASEN